MSLSEQLQKGKAGEHLRAEGIDYFALVALDIWEIAYIPSEELKKENGTFKQVVDLRINSRRKNAKTFEKYKNL